MACKGCGRAWCRCRVNSTNCITRKGSGNPGDPISFDVNLSEDDDNDVQVTEDGLLMVPRPSIAQPLYFKGRFGEPGQDFDPLVSVIPPNFGFRKIPTYIEETYDTGGMLDPDSGTFVCPRAGIWELGVQGRFLDDGILQVAFGLVLNNTFTITKNGPFTVGNTPKDSDNNYWLPEEQALTHELLEVGDVVQAFAETAVEGTLIDRMMFWGGFLTDF